MSALSTQFGGAAKSSNAAVTDTGAVILGPIEIQSSSRVGVYVSNVGGDAVDTAKLQTSPEPAGPWIDVTDAELTALAAGDSGYFSVNNLGLKYIRLYGLTAAGDTTSTTSWFCVG